MILFSPNGVYVMRETLSPPLLRIRYRTDRSVNIQELARIPAPKYKKTQKLTTASQQYTYLEDLRHLVEGAIFFITVNETNVNVSETNTMFLVQVCTTWYFIIITTAPKSVNIKHLICNAGRYCVSWRV